MNTISEYMGQGHQQCDEAFVAAENLVDAGNLTEALQRFKAFRDDMERHFAMEENVLFPAFESATGMRAGPTVVMRSEHQQMRGLFAEMDEALAAANADEYLGLSETLLMIMQQHNFKEEQILYMMADQALGADVEAVITRMQAVAHG